jgi:tetratricopeptide (TPR) repeat protein
MTPEDVDAAILFNKARELADFGQTEAATKAYHELCVSFPGNSRFFIGFGLLLQSLGHWEQSIEKFSRGLELRPHYCEGDTRLMLAESYLKSGQKTMALEQWRIVAAMSPQYPSYDAVPNEAKRRLEEHAA